jgi:hypothetical protein
MGKVYVESGAIKEGSGWRKNRKDSSAGGSWFEPHLENSLGRRLPAYFATKRGQ